MKKQPEVTDKTRQAFIEVFCELYSQKPVEKISIQQIANKSGYNRSTFYQYFSDIYELLDYVENDVLSYIKGELQRGGRVSPPSVEDISLLFEKKETYLKALLSSHGSIRFMERLKEEIPFAKQAQYPAENPLTPYIREYEISTKLALIQLWLRRDKDVPKEDLFTLIHSLSTEGISSISFS